MNLRRNAFLSAVAASCLLGLWSGPIAQADELPKLKVLYLIDNNAGAIGGNITPHCEAGRKIFEQILTETFEGQKERYKFSALGENYLKKENLLEYIREYVGAGSNDTIWFHYCGHGANDDDTGHYFATSQGDIDRSDVKEALVATGARLVVLTSDACHNPGDFQFLPPRKSPASWDIFNQLFFQHSGVTDITAATAPQLAWLSLRRGGFFGQALGDLYCADVSTVDFDSNGFVTWREAFVYLKIRTQLIFEDARENNKQHNPDAEIVKFHEQTPDNFGLADSLSEAPPTQYAMKVRLVNSTDSEMSFSARFNLYNDVSEKWAWTPNTGAWRYTVGPGEATYLNNDTGGRLVASAMNYSLSAGDIKRTNIHAEMGSSGYKSKSPKTYQLNLRTNSVIEDVSVKIHHNVFRGGRKGVLIQPAFTARRLMYVKTAVSVLFFREDGSPLMDAGGGYASELGKVGTSYEFVPVYLHSKFNFADIDGVELFMPYEELHAGPGAQRLYFQLYFTVDRDTLFNGARKFSFDYNP